MSALFYFPDYLIPTPAFGLGFNRSKADVDLHETMLNTKNPAKKAGFLFGLSDRHS